MSYHDVLYEEGGHVDFMYSFTSNVKNSIRYLMKYQMHNYAEECVIVFGEYSFYHCDNTAYHHRVCRQCA